MTLYSTFSKALTGNDNGFAGATRRMVFPKTSLTVPPESQTKLRVKFNASSTEPYSLGAAYIGHKTPSTSCDFASAPTQLTFGGSPSVVIPAGGSVWSDEISFAWNKTSDLIISEYCAGNSTSDSCRSLNGTAISCYYKLNANEAANLVVGGFILAAGVLDLISDIEMDGFQSSVINIVNSKHSISRQVNVPVALSASEAEVPEFRISLFTDATAVASLDFQTDLVHNDLGGYMDVLACGCVLTMRESDTEAGLVTAPYQIIQRGITGGNIYDHKGHYVTLHRRAKVQLQANKFYQFSVDLLATRPASGVSGQASLLVEGGNGLNSYIVTVDKNESLTLI